MTRLVSADLGEDDETDITLRPQRLDEFIGQSQARSNPEAMVQIAQADLALISKADLISEQQAEAIRRFVQEVNPGLDIEMMTNGRIAPEALFGRHGATSAQNLVDDSAAKHTEHSHTDHDHAQDPNESRHGDIATWSFVGEEPVDRDRLFGWLKMIYSLRATSLLRMKGLVPSSVVRGQGPSTRSPHSR